MKMKRKNFLDSFRSPGLLTQGGLALNEMTDEKKLKETKIQPKPDFG